MRLLQGRNSWLLSAVFFIAGAALLLFGPVSQGDLAWGAPPLLPCGDETYNPAEKCCCDDETLVDKPSGMDC